MILRRISPWTHERRGGFFEELDRIRRHMDWLSESFAGGLTGESATGVFPPINLTEDSHHIYLRAELPGIKAGDLDISVTGDSISISGERKTTTSDENPKYHRREREEGVFSRILSLPTRIDTAKVEARSENGILTVTLPKSEAAKPKQMAVRAA